MKNAKVAAHLTLISQLEMVAGSGHFKIVAFKNAAEAVAVMSTPIEDADLDDLKDVGKSVAAVVRDFLARGTSARMEQLERDACPASVMTMTQVRMIGPKTAYRLWKEHGVSSLDELMAASAAGRIPEKHVKAIEEVAKHRTKERVPHDTAKLVSEWLRLSLEPHADGVTVCGSVRRGSLDSKDIDLVASVPPERRAKLVQELADLGDLLESGPEKASAIVERYGVRMQVDLWMADDWRYGATVLYATGSKRHNIALRALAQTKGWTLNEKGMFPAGVPDFEKRVQIAGETELSIYSCLGLRYVEPDKRVSDDLISAP